MEKAKIISHVATRSGAVKQSNICGTAGFFLYVRNRHVAKLRSPVIARRALARRSNPRKRINTGLLRRFAPRNDEAVRFRDRFIIRYLIERRKNNVKTKF